MYIVMITPELSPAAKVGGLADMVAGLSSELTRRGHAVDVVLPMYSCMRYDTIEDLHEVYSELWVPHHQEWRAETVFEGRVDGVKAFFITGGSYTERPTVYGGDDDLFRFVYFCRAALEFLYKTDKRPEILHCHDWSTGLVPVMYYDLYSELGWGDSRVVFTLHNTESQGFCWYPGELLDSVQLDVRRYLQPDKLADDARPNCLNLMRGGIVYANFVTTVSPTFADEVKAPEGGKGLHHALNAHSDKLGGVLNGIDYERWNPETDPKLDQNYTAETFVEKYRNKYALREWLQLADAWKPIVSVVTRLVSQKGLDLIKHAVLSTLRHQGQFVLLGESPAADVNADFSRIADELAASPDAHLWIGYHEDLAHLIYAGSDILLVPSLYEPCGLTQMIALRYGTVPVVRATGGLADTVFDVDEPGREPADANGFVFHDPTPEGLDGALHRALDCWLERPEAFNQLAVNGMGFDHSWKGPAQDYENIYDFIRVK